MFFRKSPLPWVGGDEGEGEPDCFLSTPTLTLPHRQGEGTEVGQNYEYVCLISSVHTMFDIHLIFGL
jgi:hypothetical protein